MDFLGPPRVIVGAARPSTFRPGAAPRGGRRRASAPPSLRTGGTPDPDSFLFLMPVDPLLIPVPVRGRRFVGHRTVRLADASPAGRLRLDAVARHLQDVADDDARDAGLGQDGTWVVRRTVVEVHRAPVFREALELTTFCSGVGSRWAERRT